MRLWHELLLDKLPRLQLLGQHRECCAVKGAGWKKSHSTIDYVFDYPIEKLTAYHSKVINEMLDRGYNPSRKWFDFKYRGKRKGVDHSIQVNKVLEFKKQTPVYDEHDDEYMQECIDNLFEKGCVCKYFEDLKI